jgi:hypothetical protein
LFFYRWDYKKSYRQHPKTGLSGFIGFNSCSIVEWSGFRMVASLDRFTINDHKHILFMTKWSRLVIKIQVMFSNDQNKMAALAIQKPDK